MTHKKLDAEVQSEYEVVIRCFDNGVPEGSFSKTFNIKVKDLNEAPTDIKLSHSEVFELLFIVQGVSDQ